MEIGSSTAFRGSNYTYNKWPVLRDREFIKVSSISANPLVVCGNLSMLQRL
jgi:hypothetical protein